MGKPRKVVGFSSTSLLPTKEWEAVIQGGTTGIYYLMWRKTQELVSSKAGRTSKTTDSFQIY